MKSDGVAGMGSGPSIAGEPSTQTFAGNWNLPAGKDGSTVVVSLMEIPKPGPSSLSSYSFDITDGPTRAVASNDVASGEIRSEDTYAKHCKVEPNAMAPLFVTGKDGDGVKDAKGDYLRNPTPAMKVEFDYPQAPMTYSQRVVGITGSGKVVASIFGDGSNYHDRQYIPKGAGVARIEVQVQRINAANFLGVRIRPNSFAIP
jgi:hypothetical protein